MRRSHILTATLLVDRRDAGIGRRRAGSIDLGWVWVNPTLHRCFSLHEIDLRPAASDTLIASEENP